MNDNSKLFNIIKKLKGSSGDTVLIKRGCEATKDECATLLTQCEKSGASNCVCKSCKTDLCNNSRTIYDVKFTIIAALIMTSLLNINILFN